jgi:hypothetical protein
MGALEKWDSFYLIVGGAAGALIGLQFVVMTLIAERPPTRFGDVGKAFATPTIVHFTVVLGLAALLRAPWESGSAITLLLGVCGVAGCAYALLTAWRMHSQDAYAPDIEDWSFHALLPLASYATMAVAGWLALTCLGQALFVAGGAVMALLFCGIHNAWDSVGYQVMLNKDRVPPP